MFGTYPSHSGVFASPTPAATPSYDRLRSSEGSGESRRARVRAEPPSVLVIDDDEDARTIWSECLLQLGYVVTCESTGEAGVKAAWHNRPTAILMDLSMPGMGGIEATRRIKANPRTRDCLVIVVSAHDPSIFAEVREVGCDAYFCKPFDAFALHNILRVLTMSSEKPLHSTPVKKCLCGRTYSRAQWLTLKFWGGIHIPNSDEAIAVHTCPCGSPVAMPMQGQ